MQEEKEGRKTSEEAAERKTLNFVRVGILNIGTMTGRGKELADLIKRKNVDILCLQETK